MQLSYKTTMFGHDDVYCATYNDLCRVSEWSGHCDGGESATGEGESPGGRLCGSVPSHSEHQCCTCMW